MIIFKATLRLISINIENYFPSMKDHLENSIEQLSGDIKNIEQEFSKIAEEFPENHYEISEEYQDTMSYYKDVYPEIVYNSSFLVAYSFFERILKNIRETVERFIIEHKGNICNNGSYTEKHRNSIANITGISSIKDDNTTLWNKINDIYRNLRNSIAHDNSSLYDTNNNLLNKNRQSYNFIKNNSDFTFNSKNGEFKIVNDYFLVTLIDELKDYLDAIVQVLNENSNINFR